MAGPADPTCAHSRNDRRKLPAQSEQSQARQTRTHNLVDLTANAPWNVLAFGWHYAPRRGTQWPTFTPPQWQVVTPPLTQ